MDNNLERRDFIIALSASALVLATGCATFRRESEIDAAFNDLDELLAVTGEDNLDGVVPIVEQMRADSRALLDIHETFVVKFNSMAADRSATLDDLNSLVDGYHADRKSKRDDLLRLQDDLREALPTDAWPDVQRVLNSKSQAIAGGTA